MSVTAGLAIGSAIAGLGQGVYNTLSSSHQNKLNRQFALEQQRLQNQFNLNMWNRQNAYNSPAAQVQRLMQAGLNPNLAYGQLGSGDAGPLQSADANYKGEAPQSNIDFQGSVQSIIDTQRADEIHQKQIEKMTLENEHQKYENLLLEADVDDLPEFKEYRKQKREQELETMKQTLANMKTANEEMIESIKNLSEDTHSKELSNYVKEHTLGADIEHILNQLDLDRATYDHIQNQIQVGLSVIGLNEAQRQALLDQHELFNLTKDSMVEAINAANKLSAYMDTEEYAKNIIVNSYMGFNPVAFIDDVNGLGIKQAVFNHYGNLTKDGQKWLKQALNNKKRRQNANHSPNQDNNLQAGLTTLMFMAMMRGGFKTPAVKPIGF